MNVIQQEPIGERDGDRIEIIDDEVHVVQRTLVDWSTMRAKLRFYGQTPCEGAAKAIRQKLFDNVRRSLGVVRLQ